MGGESKGNSAKLKSNKSKWFLYMALGFLGLVIALIAFTPEPNTASDAEIDPNSAPNFRTAIEAASRPCDDAGKLLAQAFEDGGSIDPYTAYGHAINVQKQCERALSDIGEVEIPDGLEDQVQSVFSDTREACQLAALHRSAVGKAAAAVFNGDTRPSALAAVTEASNKMNAAMLLCAGGLVSIDPKPSE